MIEYRPSNKKQYNIIKKLWWTWRRKCPECNDRIMYWGSYGGGLRYICQNIEKPCSFEYVL